MFVTLAVPAPDKMWTAFVVVFVPALLHQTDAQCDNPGWILFQSSCYGFGDDYVTWAGASALCRIFDGTLAEIETEAENNFLRAYARNKKYVNVWIGGTDILTEGYWIWSQSKKPVAGFTNWVPGEPNHMVGDLSEDCMTLEGSRDYSWNDDSCNKNFPFVCEIRLEG